MHLNCLTKLILPAANWEHSPLLLVTGSHSIPWHPELETLQAQGQDEINLQHIWKTISANETLEALLNDPGQSLSQGTLEF